MPRSRSEAARQRAKKRTPEEEAIRRREYERAWWARNRERLNAKRRNPDANHLEARRANTAKARAALAAKRAARRAAEGIAPRPTPKPDLDALALYRAEKAKRIEQGKPTLQRRMA